MQFKSPFRRPALFGAVYFVEGVVLTYFSTFNILYLRTFDLSFTRIGVVGGITLIPFVLKVFIGLLSDRVNLAGLGQPLSGALVDAFGFRWMFAVLAALNLLTLPLVYGVFRLRKDIG
jgi:hypothetical protein